MTYAKINDLILHNHAIAGELETALKRVLASGWYALGPEVESFEKSFAAYCGAHYCRGLANGTDAIEIALKALGVDKGSEVITVANAGMYSGTAIYAIGAIPVYADIDLASFTISAAHAESLITSKTRAIIATHLYGRICDMPALRKVADKHNIPLLEDCAQAHGAELQGKRVGAWGDAAAFSFYPTKNLGALGDGGAIVTSSKDTHEKISRLRQYGWESKYKVVDGGGRNSRLDEIQAALLNVKLKHLDTWTATRQRLGTYYGEHIKNSNVIVPENVGKQHVYHLYVLRSPKRDGLKDFLTSKGIAVDIHYPFLDYQQPLFRNEQFAGQAIAKTHLPVSEQATREILTIPCYPELNKQDAAYVVTAINEWKA